jgi:small-conductance mechanosensitive channel
MTALADTLPDDPETLKAMLLAERARADRLAQIPHAKIWSTSVSNDSSGQHSLLTVTHFYLDADHDGAAVSQALAEIAGASHYLKPQSAMKVTAAETPFGTHYKIKAYVADSRQQFAMVTDLTLRAKERLRAMGIAFARAPYAETGK